MKHEFVWGTQRALGPGRPIGKEIKSMILRLIAVLAAVLMSATGAAAQVTTENGISVICPWVQATRPGVRSASVFMDIRVDQNAQRRLTAAQTDLAAAARVSAFQRVGGVLRRRTVDAITIGPGQVVRLVPGGYHIFLSRLTEPLIEGSTFPLFLEFDNEGGFEVQVTVVPPGAGSPCGPVDAAPGPSYYPLVPRPPGYFPGPAWVPRGSYWWRR